MPQTQFKLEGDYAPWYIGWRACIKTISDILRQFYEVPSFLPEVSNGFDFSQWIWMGTPGFGAPFHIESKIQAGASISPQLF